MSKMKNKMHTNKKDKKFYFKSHAIDDIFLGVDYL